MTNDSKSLLEYSKEVLLPEGYHDKAKVKQDKPKEMKMEIGAKTQGAIKNTTFATASNAAKSVIDQIVDASVDNKVKTWASSKLTGKKSK